MQGSYSGELRRDQDQAGILNLGDPANATIVPSPKYRRRETSAWKAKVDAAPTARDNRRTIISDWLDQVYDANHAIYLFSLFKLYIGSHSGDPYDLMAHAACSEFGAVELPERFLAPIPTVSRSEPFEPTERKHQ